MQHQLTGHVSIVGVPNVLNMLPISAKSLNPPSNRVDRSIGPVDLLLIFMNENGALECSSSDSGVEGRLAPIVVKKLAITTPRDHLSKANGLYERAPKRSSGARYGLQRQIHKSLLAGSIAIADMCGKCVKEVLTLCQARTASCSFFHFQVHSHHKLLQSP